MKVPLVTLALVMAVLVGPVRAEDSRNAFCEKACKQAADYYWDVLSLNTSGTPKDADIKRIRAKYDLVPDVLAVSIAERAALVYQQFGREVLNYKEEMNAEIVGICSESCKED
ncbi:hypothetical protein [Geomesophilobacter sediminis]|uniref:Uncharacterized protein n=1 Tax=Geomesophilobacter sediminis TaxID=2798584 RepID=A0A8J7LYM4_9BACT|nr:hypothetical protein [Geomesophilobacter sediminis]MBJ6725266.1 hypothetical protein [Geomesophilobacter sediminis]